MFILSETKGINLLTHSVSLVSKIRKGCWTQQKVLCVRAHSLSHVLIIESNSPRCCTEPRSSLFRQAFRQERNTQSDVQKASCNCLYKGSDIAETQQNYHVKLNVLLWVLSFPISTFLFTDLSCACVKLCIQPQVQLLLYCFAHSVQSFGTHGPSADSIRPTQSSDGCAAETLRGKSRAMCGKGAQTMCQRSLIG